MVGGDGRCGEDIQEGLRDEIGRLDDETTCERELGRPPWVDVVEPSEDLVMILGQVHGGIGVITYGACAYQIQTHWTH